MGRIKQSLAWWAFARNIEPDKLIAEAKRIGYEGVEMCPQELWPKVVEAGLRIVTLGGHRSLTDGLNRKENHDRIEQELKNSIELAVQWNIPVLIVFSGNRGGISEEEGLKNTVDGLRRVAKTAEEACVTLALELLNSKVDHPDYQCDHTSWGVQVCKQVASPRVKLLYDIYHMQIMEGDIIRTIRENIEYIGHFHTAGNPGRHEINEMQELYYPAIMQAIAATGYDGYVGQEFTPTKDTSASLEEAYRICNA